jgi:uncharacterized membrane protein
MHIVASPEQVEVLIILAASWLKLGLEGISVLIILVAMLFALARLIGPSLGQRMHAVRMGLARGLSLALEFQLAADIVGTAVSPDWDQIGKLAAVAGIRTFLNYFLQRELAAGDADIVVQPPAPGAAREPGKPPSGSA